MDEHIAKIHEWIKPSIGTGEIVKIVYMGGSHPGTVREIIPLYFSDDGLSLLAVEPREGKRRIRKTYKLEKILPGNAGSDEYTQALSEFNESQFNSLDDLLSKIVVYAESNNLDLNIKLEGVALGIFERTKTGRIRKNPSFCISYEEKTIDYFDDEDRPVYKPSVRPWHVSGKGFNQKAFKNFQKAAESFYEIAIDFLKYQQLTTT